MIELKEQLLEGYYILPDGTEKRYSARRRVDPITGFSSRLTGKRPVDPASNPKGSPDISERVDATRGCPFCEGNIFRMTPQFPQPLHQEGRFRCGESVLFPNLMPYGRYSAVTVFSTQHHVPLGEFGQTLYQDALQNCLDYISRVREVDIESRYQALTQNILPSSGGALLHPHMQVNIDAEPMSYHALLERTENARSAEDNSFLIALAQQEIESTRALMQCGKWQFFMAFAPLAGGEVQAVHPECNRFDNLTAADVCDLATGIRAIHRFWKDMGRNAANMVFFGTTDGAHPIFGRLMMRSPYRPWYRSDRSAYEVTAMEAASDLVPEVLAENFREGYRPA